MRYTINLDCKTNFIRKDGKIPLLLRISINGTNNYLNLGKKIDIKMYDINKKVINTQFNGGQAINSFIDRQKQRIENIIDELDKTGEYPTFAKIKAKYETKSSKDKNLCFYQFVEEMLLWEKQNTKKSINTLKNFEFNLKKLKDYRKSLSIHEINTPFIEEYKGYLQNTLSQKENTVYHAMCFLRKYSKILFKKKLINKYPFDEFKVGGPFSTELSYLEPEEITKLHDLYDSKILLAYVKKAKNKHAQDFNIGEKYQEVLRYFLVACYTGLRHSDIKTLSSKHIKGNYIVKEVVKGREGKHKLVRIPIRKRLASLINTNTENQNLFFGKPVMENAQSNVYLKSIMKIANINKHITFHIARHSFAIVSLLLGIKIEVISDILGHSELTTTQRYAKVIDRLREQEMNKWDKLLKEEQGSNNQIDLTCPNCENTLMKIEKNIIKLKNIPCTCTFCTTDFIYKIA